MSGVAPVAAHALQNEWQIDCHAPIPDWHRRVLIDIPVRNFFDSICSSDKIFACPPTQRNITVWKNISRLSENTTFAMNIGMAKSLLCPTLNQIIIESPEISCNSLPINLRAATVKHLVATNGLKSTLAAHISIQTFLLPVLSRNLNPLADCWRWLIQP